MTRSEGKQGALGPDEVEVVRTASGKFTMRGATSSREVDVMEALRPDAPRPLQLAVLQDVIGLKLREIAYAASVTEQSVGNWKKYNTPGRPAAYDDLRAVVQRIMRAGTADPPLIGSWLRSRNEGLGYKRPLDMLKAGEFERVLDVADSFIAFSPPVEPEPGQREVERAQPEPPDLERAAVPDADRERTLT